MKINRIALMLSVLALSIMLVLMISASATTENVLYLFPQDSSAAYCDTTEVNIMAGINESDTATATEVNITFDPNCVNITNWVGNATVWKGGTTSTILWSIPSGFIRITTSVSANPPVSGNVPLGTLTLHCNNTEYCKTYLNFTKGKYTRPLPPGGNIYPTVQNGTFTCPAPVTGDIIINEIMYNPSPTQGDDADMEWIELYNNDTVAINISDWTIDGNTISTDPLMQPGNYAILAMNKTAFDIYYGALSCPVIDVTIALNNGGDTVVLKNSSAATIDTVTYDSAWGADGNNKTLELNATGGWEESAIDDGTPCVVNSVLGVLTTVTQTPSPNEAGWNNGTVVLSFRRVDPSGTGVNYTNLSATPSVTVNITNGVPIANQTQILPLYGSGNNFTVFNGSATPKLNHTLNETFNVNISTEGTTTIWYYSVDKNATPNVESVKNITVKIDRSAPTVTVDTPTDGQNLTTGTVWVNGTFNDTGSSDVNTNTLVIRVNGTTQTLDAGVINATLEYFNYSISLPDGSHNATVDVNDYAGNPAIQKMVNFAVDTEAPNFTDWIPRANITDNTPWINATFTDAGTGVNVSATVMVVNGSVVTPNSSTSTEVTYNVTTPFNDGIIPVNISITDYVGNTTWKNWTVFVDTVAPTATIDTPNEGQYLTTRTVWINGTFSDSGGCGVNASTLVIRVNGTTQTLGAEVINVTLEYFNYSVSLPDGCHNTTVDVDDYANHSAIQQRVNFTVDTQAPTFTITVKPNYAPLYIANLTVVVNETNWPGPKPNVSVTNESGVVPVTDTWDLTNLTWTGNYSIIATGTSNYTITVNGTDLAGNYHESVAYSNVTYVTFTANIEKQIPATPPNTTVNITTTADVPAAAGITVTKMETRPENVSAPTGVNTSAGIFIDIDAEESLRQNVSWLNITVNYNETDITARGILEKTLRIYYYNESTSLWERYDYPDGGINTAEDYVWANIQHLSIIAVMGAAADITPPAAITDLAASSPASSSIKLTWTAPGDDGITGTATTYDVRYSTSTITAANWATAIQATGEPIPAGAGAIENFPVTGLSSSTPYYFAIETADGVPNWSPLSNVASGTTSAAPRRPGGGARVVTPTMNVPIDPTTGAVTSTTTLTVEKATLTIAAGVIIKDAAGNPLATSITTLHTPTTAETVGAIAAYDLGPSGTTFSKPIDLVIEYDPADIPAGFNEKDLVVKMYDGTKWIDLPTTVDTAAHTATTKVSHFSIFALFAAAPVAPPPVITPKPTIPPVVTPIPTPPVVPPVKRPWGLIIGIIIAVIIVGAAAYYFYTKKKA